MSFITGGSHNVTTKADKITEFQATTCEYNAVPLLIGTTKVGANLVEFSELESKEIKTSVKTGKHSHSTTIDYKYYSKLVLALGEGSNDIALSKVWVGGKEYTSLDAMNNSKEEGSGLTFMANGGTPYSQKYDDLALLYGRVYLGYNQANVPSYNFEVRGQLRANGRDDANPADVIRFLLQLLGRESYIDQASFNHYKSFCESMGLLISTPGDYFNEQKTAHEIIEEILTLTNTYMFWSVDKYKFVPLYPQTVGNWIPDTTVQYSLNKNDFERNSLSFKRKDSSQQYNAVKVEFTNRSNNYEKESIQYIDVASVQAQGVRQVSVSAAWLHTKAAAVKLAKMMAEKYLNEVTEYSFKLPWNFCRLEPGDLVELNDETLNISEVARISEINEAKNGIISVKAISTPLDNYRIANYTVSNEYQHIDYNIEGGDTEAPIFITPPSELVTAASGIEVWLALRGASVNWGGCQVHNAWDDEHYAYSGIQLQEALVGKVQADNDSAMTVKLSNVRQQELLPNQLIWVNGEIIRYSAATLQGANTYRLTGLERGLYNTGKAIHAINDTFVVLDNALYVVQLLKEHVGKPLYFKLPSFNIFKGQLQDINELDSYQYVVRRYDIPNVTGLSAVASGWSVTSTVNAYQINITWTKPDWADFERGLVYYKNSTHSTWTYADSGEEKALIAQAVPGDTYTIAVCTKDIYGNYELPDSAPQTTCTVTVSAETPNTPTGFSLTYTDVITASWNVVTNAIINRYEIRTSASYSGNNNLLASVTDTSTAITLSSRSGTLYLYAVSASGNYSSPARYNYSKTAPAAPTITATAGLKLIHLKSNSIPNDCYAVKFTLTGAAHSYSYVSRSNVLTVEAASDIYDVTACFVDVFGDGTACTAVHCTVAAYIDPALLESESISLAKLSQDAQDAIANGGVNAVNVAVRGLLGAGAALTLQPDGSYALVASNGETLTGIFANQDGVIRLQGQYINITGDTVIGNNVITKDMIQSNAVTAAKLAAGAVTADKIDITNGSTAARITVNNNLFTVYDANNKVRVYLGIWTQ